MTSGYSEIPLVKKGGLMRISWPKATSKIKIDLIRKSLRSYELEHGLMDIKTCEIDKDWSALKLFFRLIDR